MIAVHWLVFLALSVQAIASIVDHDAQIAAISRAAAWRVGRSTGQPQFPAHKTGNRFRRRLTQDTSCVWNDDSGTCLFSESAFIDAFNGADSDLARVVSQAVDCANRGDASSCSSFDVCTWTGDACALLDITRGRESSPCATAAPASITLLSTADICPLQGSDGDCQSVSSCEWDSSVGTCIYSDFLAYHGFTTADFGVQFEQAVDAKLPFAADAFAEAFGSEESIGDASTVLNWEVPGSDCPEGIDSRICDYTDVLLSNLLPSLFYCQSLTEGCDAADICETDASDGTCTSLESVSITARNAALNSMAASVENGVDRGVLENLLACAQQTDSSACSDPCVWDTSVSLCLFPLEAVAQILAENGSGDGLCDYLSLFGNAGCSSFGDADSCNASSDCIYDSASCVLDLGILADKAIEDDSGLASTLDGLRSTCSGFTSAAECGPA